MAEIDSLRDKKWAGVRQADVPANVNPIIIINHFYRAGYIEIWVVYHLLGETGWSTVVVNGARQYSKWKFSVECARSISTTFSRKIESKTIQAKRPETSKK